MSKADIGLIGLAVMGENLVLNMESHGFCAAVYNRSVEKVDRFIEGRGKGKNFIGCHSIEELCANLKAPRRIMMMVKAGKPVDELIEQLLPHLDQGDILIDGGNSFFQDTIRRTKYVESKGKLYGLVVPDFALCEKEHITREKLESIMNENLKTLNEQVAGYERLVSLIIYPNEFEKTPKKSIKRYLYDISKLV